MNILINVLSGFSGNKVHLHNGIIDIPRARDDTRAVPRKYRTLVFSLSFLGRSALQCQIRLSILNYPRQEKCKVDQNFYWT